jgi:hypothetical protein
MKSHKQMKVHDTVLWLQKAQNRAFPLLRLLCHRPSFYYITSAVHCALEVEEKEEEEGLQASKRRIMMT